MSIARSYWKQTLVGAAVVVVFAAAYVQGEDPAPDKPNPEAAARADGDKDAPRERDGDRPREGERDGDRPREGARDGDRPREGARDGDRPREGARDGDRPREGERDGDRPREGARDGAPAPERSLTPQQREHVMAAINHLREAGLLDVAEHLSHRYGPARRDEEPRREPAVRDGDRGEVRESERRESERREAERDARPETARGIGGREAVRQGETDELLGLLRALRGEVDRLRGEVGELRKNVGSQRDSDR